MNIGRKIYYEIATGNVLHVTSEMAGDVVETTIDQDFSNIKVLKERVRETVGVIKLSFGQYSQDFANCNGYRVNIGTKQIEFFYPDPNLPPGEPVYQPPLTEQVKNLENENLELKLALAEMAETNELEKTEMQLAIAELAELVAGGA